VAGLACWDLALLVAYLALVLLAALGLAYHAAKAAARPGQQEERRQEEGQQEEPLLGEGAAKLGDRPAGEQHCRRWPGLAGWRVRLLLLPFTTAAPPRLASATALLRPSSRGPDRTPPPAGDEEGEAEGDQEIADLLEVQHPWLEDKLQGLYRAHVGVQGLA
jgi:hypothetical protein